ncbi:MAG: RpoL/Rpb11 RNA polymerase subunit family protein, partial [Candidatus Woesearchaeota archaeon]
MQFHVIEDNKTRFQAELEGADNTICNVLVKELWDDENVVHAAYNIEHPIVG